jgi:hypothetical protein
MVLHEEYHNILEFYRAIQEIKILKYFNSLIKVKVIIYIYIFSSEFILQ